MFKWGRPKKEEKIINNIKNNLNLPVRIVRNNLYCSKLSIIVFYDNSTSLGKILSLVRHDFKLIVYINKEPTQWTQNFLHKYSILYIVSSDIPYICHIIRCLHIKAIS